MSISRVQFDGHDLINLTNDTVSANVLLNGYTAHDSSGAVITGSYIGVNPTGTYSISENGEYDITNYKYVNVNVASGQKVGVVHLNNKLYIYTGVTATQSGTTLIIGG